MIHSDKVPYQIPVPNNMGIVRYVLALGVMIAHFNELAGASMWWPVSSFNAVGGFFALSGFLMIGSWLRHPDFKSYMLSRCRRLLPAYWSVVIFFALALWPLSTASHYFFSAGLWEYLFANLSFLNFLHPTLPGVFEGQSMEAVNGSLWTMKVEWFLYLSLPVVAWILVKFKRSPGLVLSIVYVVSVLYRIGFYYLFTSTGKEIYRLLSYQFMGQMMYFYTGVLIYYFFTYFMRCKWWILAACLLLSAFDYDSFYLRIVVEPFVVSSLVLWFSMVGRWGVWCGRHDNISYNIYLIHFPVIQIAVCYSLVSRCGIPLAFAAVTAVTVILSFLLNRFIERPIQSLHQ